MNVRGLLDVCTNFNFSDGALQQKYNGLKYTQYLQSISLVRIPFRVIPSDSEIL